MISIVVCTRNRAEILGWCIESLLNQTGNIDYEIIVVDNASTDHTRQVVESFIAKHNRVRYLFEAQQGSSKARNTGVLTARYSYLGFVDDDGKVRTDFIAKAVEVITAFKFDCFGGWFIPWYRSPKPKWFPDAYGSYPCFLNGTGILKKEYLPCGIMFIKKDVFWQAGGFSENLGMKGNVMGYGEENLLQDCVRQQGGVIGFCSDLILEHLVAEYKYNVKWQLHRFYAKGRDAQVMKGKLNVQKKIVYQLKAISYGIISLIKFSPRLLKKNYYWQNWILDSLKFPLHLMGSSLVN